MSEYGDFYEALDDLIEQWGKSPGISADELIRDLERAIDKIRKEERVLE